MIATKCWLHRRIDADLRQKLMDHAFFFGQLQVEDRRGGLFWNSVMSACAYKDNGTRVSAVVETMVMEGILAVKLLPLQRLQIFVTNAVSLAWADPVRFSSESDDRKSKK
jgi:hypothetical protein